MASQFSVFSFQFSGDRRQETGVRRIGKRCKENCCRLQGAEQASSRELSCRCGDDDHDGIYHEVTEVNGGSDDE